MDETTFAYILETCNELYLYVTDVRFCSSVAVDVGAVVVVVHGERSGCCGCGLGVG